MTERTADNGWITVRKANGETVQQYDPETAKLLVQLREADRATFAGLREAN